MKFTKKEIKEIIKQELRKILKEFKEPEAQLAPASDDLTPLSDLDAMKAQHDAENAHADVMAPGGPFEQSYRR